MNIQHKIWQKIKLFTDSPNSTLTYFVLLLYYTIFLYIIINRLIILQCLCVHTWNFTFEIIFSYKMVLQLCCRTSLHRNSTCSSCHCFDWVQAIAMSRSYKVWSKFSSKTTDGEILNFRIVDVPDDRLKDVADLVQKHFVTEEAFFRASGKCHK